MPGSRSGVQTFLVTQAQRSVLGVKDCEQVLGGVRPVPGEGLGWSLLADTIERLSQVQGRRRRRTGRRRRCRTRMELLGSYLVGRDVGLG